MEDTAKKFCSILFDVLEKKGVKNVICSPGSRNVPLLIASASRENIRKHFVVDERAAGFVGLGISLVKKEPVALICTSGTALLNYAPAIAEAYYQSVPLIVISADRPLQWIDQDDSQTLRQDSALENYVKRSYSIPALGEDNEEMLWYVNRISNDAMIEACSGRPGPVHINIHLSEPLNGKAEKSTKEPRIIKEITGEAIANKEVIRDLAKQLSQSKVMLVAGFAQPDSFLQKALAEFSKHQNVVVMAETISNLHLNQEDYSIDSVLTAYNDHILDELSPDIIISLGGALVSRKLKEYLRRNSNKCEHWIIGYSHVTTDPFMSLSIRIQTDPARFFRNINSVFRKFKTIGNVAIYKELWAEKRKNAQVIKDSFIKNCAWSELKAFDFILNYLPSDYNLCLSNGTPIRYAQIIRYNLPHASYCNRGVSGIDGSTSTAIGAAKAFKGKTILITGDLSLSYDIGALALKDIPESFKIIVIDNQGGGIFRFIPSTSNLIEREEYLCQPPILPLKELSEGYNWDYFEINDEISLKETLPLFFKNPHKSILKVTCDGEESAKILKQYMALKA